MAAQNKGYVFHLPLQLCVSLVPGLINGMYAKILAAPGKFSRTR